MEIAPPFNPCGFSLLLNATFEPLRIVPWQRAITMLVLGKVEVIEEYDRWIRGVTVRLRHPAVLRLHKPASVRARTVKFSRQNIFLRDRFTCQYCGRSAPASELTYDHVMPRNRGGRTEWTNIVTCCIRCNKLKGGRTPEEASMRLLRPAAKPRWTPGLSVAAGISEPPHPWRAYLGWRSQLERRPATARGEGGLEAPAVEARGSSEA